MPGKKNNDLVSTKITRACKQKLEFIKSQYLASDTKLATGDYTALAHLVEQEYDRLRLALINQA